MRGGAKVYITDLLKKYSQPIYWYLLVGIAIAITFVREIPISIRSQASTTLGRFFLFTLTIAIGEYYCWTSGLLMAVLTLLLLSMSPRNSREGFQTTSLKLVTNSDRWFIEKVLKENPTAFEEQDVSTQAIQDSSNSSRSTTAQGGSK
jgi:hypothetical protein